jgi:aryl-alcohol dehydrogenase-like predicted oxidoreductase
MQYNPLGKTGLLVPELGFGLGTLAGTEDFDRKVSMCIDAGITLFDTSDAYSGGRSEELLGDVLQGRRSQVLLSSKATYRVGPGANDIGSSRFHLLHACEASLRRLRTDWIDLYQLHAPDLFTRPEETMRVLDDLVRSGKVRYIGCSNYSGWQVMRAQGAAQSLRINEFSFQQILYSLACRDAEFELIPVGRDQGIATMVWGPLAAGFLSGKYKRGEARPEGARLTRVPEYNAVPDWEQGFRVLDVAREIADAHRVALGQVAINWLLRKPWVATVILGARTVEQLAENLGTLAWRLSVDEMARLDAVSAPRAGYPYWVQRLGAPERNPPLSGYR